MENKVYHYIYNSESEHWWFKVRRELMGNLLVKYAPESKTILDIGCGTGGTLLALKEMGKDCYGVDVSDVALDYCKKNGLSNVFLGNVEEKLPFEDNKFDVVTVLDVLEHTKDDNKTINEIKRVLRPEGVAIFMVPALNILWGRQDVISHHFRRYNLKNLTKKINHQLEVIFGSYFNFFLFIPILIVRLFVNKTKIQIPDENRMNNKFLNRLFYNIFKQEIRIINRAHFPFGVSVVVVAKKYV